jgi:hypothetical protein
MRSVKNIYPGILIIGLIQHTEHLILFTFLFYLTYDVIICITFFFEYKKVFLFCEAAITMYSTLKKIIIGGESQIENWKGKSSLWTKELRNAEEKCSSQHMRCNSNDEDVSVVAVVDVIKAFWTKFMINLIVAFKGN